MKCLAILIFGAFLLTACGTTLEGVPDPDLETSAGQSGYCIYFSFGKFCYPKLEPGDNNKSWIRYAQDLLKSSSHTPGTSDGLYGPATENAVRSLQKARCLNQTGKIDTNEWQAILKGKTFCSTRLTHKQGVARLSNGGITAISSSGNCSYKNRVNCTSFEYIQTFAIDRLIQFKNASRCSFVVTGGTEIGHSQSGNYRHDNGHKIDLRLNTCLDNYISRNLTDAGYRPSDGAKAYKDSNGNYFYKENNHWDIMFLN